MAIETGRSGFIPPEYRDNGLTVGYDVVRIHIEGKLVLSKDLPRKSDALEKSGILQMGDIPSVFFPEHKEATV